MINIYGVCCSLSQVVVVCMCVQFEELEMLMKPAILRHDDMFFNIYIFSLYIQQMPAVYWESLKKKKQHFSAACCVLSLL